MNYIISGRNIELTDALKDYARSKIGKVERFFEPSTEVHITFSVQKDRKIVETTIRYRGIVFRVEEENTDMYAALDRSSDILERQIRKNRTRLAKKMYDNPLKYEKMFSEDQQEKEEEYKLIKNKSFSLKPMDVEEALLQLNLVGHTFFVFVNVKNNKVNVVYRRKSGGYGILEPEE
ncbi:MAG: ribosome-associated translation inhibitor RaiA [Clostridiales bacterium]|nr:ribosome-associated translation inhibitor RaiA [Clostridiales bacterium]